MTKRVLVTGGCGFVGRRFVRRFLQMGDQVTVVDDLSTGLSPDRWPSPVRLDAEENSRLVFQRGDFRKFCEEQAADFDLVVHLAAVVGGRLVIEGDPLAVATDLAIDATFFNWLVRSEKRPAKVIYFSSSAVYPVADQRKGQSKLLSEEMVDFGDQLGLPDMTYGWSKLTGEFLARHAAKSYDLDVVVYRPFSGYGEEQDLSYPFPSIVQRVGRRESPIIVWGSGDQARDFIHIEDVVDVVLASMNHLAPAEALNLGSGIATTFRDLAAQASEVDGHDAPIINDATKPEGVFSRVGDCRKMLTYHKPTISLREGLEKAFVYQREQGLIA